MKRSLNFLLIIFFLLLATFACALPTPAVQINQVTEPSASSIPATNAPPASSIPVTSEPPATPTATPIPLPDGMPSVETNLNAMMAILKSGTFKYFEEFAAEKHNTKDFDKPGTVNFTVVFPANETIFLNYGWCAVDSATLNQDLSHIHLKFYFNDQEIPHEYVLSANSTQSNGWECAHGGMLLSNWKPGKYKFRVAANFDVTINDGQSDFEAGDYILEYDVTVK